MSRKTVLSGFAFALLISTLAASAFAFKPRFQSGILTYNANNISNDKATVIVYVPKSINPKDPFHGKVLVHLKSHENTQGTKAIVYGGDGFTTDFQIAVQQNDQQINSKNFKVVTSTNNPPTGNKINLQTEKVFISVLQGEIASLVVTAK